MEERGKFPFTQTETDKLIERGQKLLKSFVDYEGKFQQSFTKDVQFANADSDNNWQWEQTVLDSRAGAPSMTINMTLIHCLLVQNDIKKNPPAITVRPVGGGATAKSANVYGGLIREIARASDATNIYLKSSEHLIQGGVGYWRVLTEYEDEEVFDRVQVLRIRSIRNPMGVAIDPDAKEPSGADARWGMIFEDVKNDLLKEEHEKYKDCVGASNAILQTGADSWETEDHTRVAEWYDKEMFQDQMLEFISDDGRPVTVYMSEIPTELRQELLKDTRTRQRPATRTKIVWYKIFGNKIVDYKETAGRKYIPIVRVVGQETIIDGQLDRKGMVRNLKDPQRNMNYWVSAGAMQVALQTNVPWVVPAAAVENHKEWEDANVKRYAYLSYNHKDDQNDPIPAPNRPAPPVMASAYIQGIQIAAQQFKDISGQHEATQGANGNERTGVAIDARKIQGETSTYHFPNALAMGVAHTGRIILDQAPVVYDTARMIRISNVDMSQSDVQVDPQARMAHQEAEKDDEENATDIIWNPQIGRYEVEAEAGPDYATQREWTVDTMGAILAQNKDLWTVVGDLFVENMDFPGAEEMAERIRRTMNPAVLGKGPSPNEQALQKQLAEGQKLIESLVESLAEKQRLLDNKDEELTIKAVEAGTKQYDAESRRIKEAGNAQANFANAGLEPDIRNIMADATADAMNPDLAETLAARRQAEQQEAEPVE